MLNSPSHEFIRCAFGKSGAKVVIFSETKHTIHNYFKKQAVFPYFSCDIEDFYITLQS
jgi:hypothetical protein